MKKEMRQMSDQEPENVMEAGGSEPMTITGIIVAGFYKTAPEGYQITEAEVHVLEDKVVSGASENIEGYAHTIGKNYGIDLTRRMETAVRRHAERMVQSHEVKKMEALHERVVAEFNVLAPTIVASLKKATVAQIRQLQLLQVKYLSGYAPLGPIETREAFPDLSYANLQQMEQRGRRLLKKHGASDELLAYVRSKGGTRSNLPGGKHLAKFKKRITGDAKSPKAA